MEWSLNFFSVFRTFPPCWLPDSNVTGRSILAARNSHAGPGTLCVGCRILYGSRLSEYFKAFSFFYRIIVDNDLDFLDNLQESVIDGSRFYLERFMKKGISDLYARRAKEVQASAIREICKLVARPEVKSMAGGWPDPETFPVEEIKELSSKLLTEKAHLVLQYGASEGLMELRETLTDWVARREGIDFSLDNIIITHGSTQGIELAAKILIEQGDVAFVGLPTYFGGSGACQTFGAELVGIPLDEHGMIPEILEERIKEAVSSGRRVKLVYVIPDFQNPTGSTLPLERRRRIVELANEYNLAIIEDNPYRDLCFSGEPLPPIKHFDTEGRVIYLRSFSKIFCPGFRLSFVIAEKDVIRRMVIARQFEDACANMFGQYLLNDFIREGYLDKQIEKNSAHYKKKRDRLLSLLDEHFPSTVKWNRPEGGFFVFVHMPEGMDGEALLHEAVDQDVAFVAGSPFFIDGSGRNTFRLSYAQLSIEEMAEAVEVLGGLLSERTTGERM